MSFPYLHIQIQKQAKTPLFRQVYEKIRDDILTGSLSPGTLLPPTRRLAKELQISRNVVMAAYEQLHAEGYIEASAGSHTRVAHDTHYRQYKRNPRVDQKPDLKPARFDIAFQTGIPDLTLFPRALWGKYLKEAAMEAREDELAYDTPSGHQGLRQTLADYLYKSRGISIPADRIVITSGATQALFLTALMLYKDGCEAVIEDPGGFGVIEILRTAGYRLCPVAANGGDLDVSRIRLTPDTRLVYVTPSHQFPMGNIMPVATRISLLKCLHAKNALLVEDDYDSEFRYDGAPIHPLKALDPEQVVYVGSFSKVLSPALRIGYAVLPETLLEPFRKLKRFSDAQSPLIDQIALKNFIRDGAFEKHVYKMKKVYEKKRNVLMDSLLRAFGSSVRICGENAGLHLVAEFKDIRFDLDSGFEICHNRVLIPSVEKHTAEKGCHAHQLVFGYGNLSEDRIIRGITALNRFR